MDSDIAQRLGILGGTFDPVHNAHLIVAGKVREAFGLSAVIFIPAACPPHKKGFSVISFADRLAMLRLAVHGTPFFLVSPIEADRPGPSYSIDTLLQLRREYPPDVELFFIIGSDAFAEVASWKNYVSLLDLTNFIVIARTPIDYVGIARLIGAVFPEHVFDNNLCCWNKPGCFGKIYTFIRESIQISSTEIRKRVQQRDTISDLVPKAVADYIDKHFLYE